MTLSPIRSSDDFLKDDPNRLNVLSNSPYFEAYNENELLDLLLQGQISVQSKIASAAGINFTTYFWPHSSGTAIDLDLLSLSKVLPVGSLSQISCVQFSWKSSMKC